MKKLVDTIIFLFSFILICLIHCSHETKERRDIIYYCPQVGEVDGWHPEREAQIAKGEDLFLLINGGAEIYHEYGFKQAVYQTYGGENGKTINLEIYEMDSPECAYGIYTFKTGKAGKLIDVGHEGWLEAYYLNFWEGNFLVTLIGFDSEQETLDGLMEIAKTVDAKIQVPIQRPPFTNYLPKENLKVNGITYIKGNLGLFNQYEFDSKNIFGLKEGIIGDYGDYSVFVFRYNDQEESLKWFEFAKMHLKKSSQFYDFIAQDHMFSMTNNKGNRLTIKPYQHTILIVSGTRNTNVNHIFGQLETQINQHRR